MKLKITKRSGINWRLFPQQVGRWLAALPQRILFQYISILELMILVVALLAAITLTLRLIYSEPTMTTTTEGAVPTLQKDRLDELELLIEERQAAYSREVPLGNRPYFELPTAP